MSLNYPDVVQGQAFTPMVWGHRAWVIHRTLVVENYLFFHSHLLITPGTNKPKNSMFVLCTGSC